ncbi:MAG TPA: hypothetical protein VNO52_13845 [Methylomirabilota bacterium]|nr:hypothetical protein [Methylomirabilota bacterium]
MNSCDSNQCCRTFGIFAAVAGTFLIVAALVWAMRHYTQPPPLNQARVAERKKALAELNAENTRALAEAEVIDKDKGLVRLPIATAMDLVVKEYATPAAARSNLMAAVDKANFKPAPPPPPPNEYE